MYSPIRQVDAQLDVYRKIWQNYTPTFWTGILKKYNGDNIFSSNYRGYVVACNAETILNLRHAPKNIKNRVVRADQLIDKIKEDISNIDPDTYTNQDGMLEWANRLLEVNIDFITDYYEDYKNKLVLVPKDKQTKKEYDNNTCPKCGGKLVERTSKYGKFMGCENYPRCKYIKK